MDTGKTGMDNVGDTPPGAEASLLSLKASGITVASALPRTISWGLISTILRRLLLFLFKGNLALFFS